MVPLARDPGKIQVPRFITRTVRAGCRGDLLNPGAPYLAARLSEHLSVRYAGYRYGCFAHFPAPLLHVDCVNPTRGLHYEREFGNPLLQEGHALVVLILKL